LIALTHRLPGEGGAGDGLETSSGGGRRHGSGGGRDHTVDCPDAGPACGTQELSLPQSPSPWLVVMRKFHGHRLVLVLFYVTPSVIHQILSTLKQKRRLLSFSFKQASKFKIALGIHVHDNSTKLASLQLAISKNN
jgi:hypothetical protein